MLCRWWALVMLAPAIAAASAPAQTPGERWWGVVVGVGEYARLDASLSLDGPPNDVPLVVTWLRRQGVPRHHLTVLADQVPSADGLPTRAAILGALAALPNRMRSGDVAFLYFAGHGSQQPQGGREWSKADGLDEIFLPRDVGHWDSRSGRVEGAIVDYEIGSAVEALRARGVFVWLVFDSCHSATLARSLMVPHVRVRSVAPLQLGVPPTSAIANTPSPAAERLVKVRDSAASGGYVAFYAAQTVDSAPELPLPPGEPGRQVHGLFTYALLRALATSGGGSYREVAHRILAYYDSIYPATTPEFEGQLDGPIGAPSAPLLSPAVWPAEHKGREFRIESGRLNGIEPDSLLALYAAIPASGEAAPIGLLQVSRVTLTDAWAEPVADPVELKAWGIPADRSADVASGVVRMLRIGVDTLVRVAGPARCFASLPPPYGCESPASTSQDIAEVARARELATQVGCLPPGAELTSNVDAADLFLLVRGSRLLVVRSGASALEHSVGIDLDSQTASEDLKRVLFQANRSVALLRLAIDFPEKSEELRTEVRMRGATGGWSSLEAQRLAPIPFGAELSIQLQNIGTDDLDVTILAIDDTFGIFPVYPVDGQSNLLRKGTTRIEVSGWARPAGENELVFIVEKARAGRPHDLGYLAQPGITRHASGTGLAALLERIGFSPRGTRASISEDDLQSSSIKILRYEVSDGT
jgi:hypothetical protein